MNIEVELKNGVVVVTWPTGNVGEPGTPETEFVGELDADEAFELCAALFHAALALTRPN